MHNASVIIGSAGNETKIKLLQSYFFENERNEVFVRCTQTRPPVNHQRVMIQIC